ncbi:MAG TPA: hypothetical protein VE994_05685 [Terriglobales bacterium]|nr:hypothetical protein [Terriglobales bacterium]
MEYDPIQSLEAIGYVQREASFLYLVAVHSGYFLRRQYHYFTQREGGRMATRFLRKAHRHRHIQVIECGQRRHIYHLTAKPVYAALGLAGSQHRRIKSDAYMKSRLMVLDFMLDHLDADALITEAAKVDFFTTQYGVKLELLPQSYMGRPLYFSEGFPILVSRIGVPRFTFFDEGQISSSRFENFLDQYQPLFSAIRASELIYLADTEANVRRAKAVFEHCFPTDRLRGVTPLTPLGVDHFLKFLRARQFFEAEGGGVLSSELQLLREGEPLYTTLEHQALYAAWKAGATNEEKIRERFQQAPLRMTFTATVLPYSYPIYTLRQDGQSEEGDATHQQTPQETPAIEA